MKYLKPLLLGVLLSLALPSFSFADVKINEVAWMGTAKSQYSEWIELYNDEAEAVSLAGWKFYVAGSEVLYTLSKSIAAGGYLLVERTTASAPDAVSGINDESGSFGSGGLSNAGENLVLKDAKGAVVDSLPFGSGWPAGDSDTKDTMQWNGEKWITAPGTPDTVNASVADIPPAKTAEPSSTPAETKAGASSSSAKQSTTGSKTVTTKSKLTVTAPKTIFQGVRNEFDATVDLPLTLASPQGYYYWNMGDGTTYVQSSLSSIGYTYHYPGSYTVSLAYYSSPAASKPYLQASASAVVTAPSATLSVLNGGSALQINNTSLKVMDIGQWPIATKLGTRSLPPLTSIAAKSHIVVTAQSLGLASIQNPILSTPDGTVVGKK